MTAPTDQFVEIANRTQEAVTTAVRTWADTVQDVAGSFAGGTSNGHASMPDVRVALDRYFDFAQQVLDNQRKFAQSWLSAGAHAAETVTEQAARAAQSVTAHTVNAAEATVDRAAEATNAAGERSAATARAARNAASKN